MIDAGHRPLGQNKFQEAWRSDNDDILATLIYVHTLYPSSRRSGLTSTTKKRCRAALMQQHPHKTPTPLRTTSSDDYIPPFDGIYNTHTHTHTKTDTISLTHTHTHTHPSAPPKRGTGSCRSNLHQHQPTRTDPGEHNELGDR